MEYSVAGGKLIHEKNQKQKISWHYPFKAAWSVPRASEGAHEPRGRGSLCQQQQDYQPQHESTNCSHHQHTL